MTISSLTSSSAASQLGYVSKTGSATASGESGQVRNGPPPPPRDGGGFVDAIASALQSIGVTDDGGTTSGTGSDSTSTAGGNAAQALGSFLQELMGALHEQGASSSSSSSSTGEGQGYGPPPGAPGGPGGPGGGGGPGKLGADLQSLIAKLSSSSEPESTGTDGTDSTDGTDTSTTSLETSFESLLQALGSDTSDSGTKLASFLQALSDKLPGAGSSGNLINTSV